MPEEPASNPYPTPANVVAAVAALFAGGISMAFNPVFVVSVVAIGLGTLTLRNARTMPNPVTQGIFRIFAIMGIMGAAGGAMILAFT